MHSCLQPVNCVTESGIRISFSLFQDIAWLSELFEERTFGGVGQIYLVGGLLAISVTI